MKPPTLDIEERDLAGGYVEGYLEIDEIAAFLALQTNLPYATVQARIIEAHGYCRRPPRGGKKIIFVLDSFGGIDDQAIRAMRRVVEDFVTVAEVQAVKTAYLASEYGDPWWIAWDQNMHPHTVMAILDNLHDQDRLPAHPSWS